MPSTYQYFVDGTPYTVESDVITGAMIMSLIPNFNRAYTLFYESPGPEPDKKVQADQTISLGRLPLPIKFYTVPPATYGS